MEIRPSPELDFFPSTLEHRPLHVPEKVALKQYFAVSGADEYELYTPSMYAITRELADLEAWAYGLRLWGRECIVRATCAATQMLAEAWEAGLAASDGDAVSVAVAYEQVLSPADAVSIMHYWGNIPSEEKAIRIMERELPLPDDWFVEPLHSTLQAKPFFWGALAGWHLVLGILIKRDPAAVLLAQACCGAARMRMLAGRSPEQAAAEVRDRMILALRTWMGRKW
jgi:hypothetical protein